MSTLIGYNEQGFIEKPATGWLHEDGDLIDGNSITYSISYVGMVPVFESINTWKQDLRTELVREAIVRLADHAQLLTANKKRKVSKKVQKVLGAPSKQWGCECRLALSVEDFAIKNGVNNREMFKHQINSISFASGGEGATIDFVAYVGKDTRSGRGCHIFNCPRKSHLVLLTMGQAFDLSYRRFKARKVQPLSVNQSGDGWGADSTPSGPTAGAYERFSNGRGMASSQPGVYDNFVPTSANDYESFPQRRGPESDLYGSTSSPGNGIYDNGMGQRQMKHSDDGIYDNGLGKSDGIYDNRPNNASEYEISPSTSNKIFDDPLYESLKGKPPEKDKMAYSQDGIYDNGLGGGQDGVYDNTPGQGRPTGKKGSEMEEDIYGGVGGDGEGVYDTAGGGRKGMKYSQDGIYDNPLAGKGQDGVYDNTPGQRRPTGKKGSEVEEDIYGGVGGDGEGVYDTAGGGRKGMKYSQDGIYDNPLAGKGQDGVYDNTPGQRRPTGKKGSEVEEDIYGGVGGDGEGVYDTAGGGRKGMKYSQDGIYDNPLAGKGQDGVYDNTPGQRRPTGKKGSEVEEDIYGGVGGDGEGVYDTAGGGRKGMKYSQDGIYDNPLAGKGQDGVYDNTPGQRRPTGKKGSEVEEDIYGGVGGDGEGVYDTAGGGRKGMKYSQDGIYDNPLAGKGQDGVYDNTPGQRRPTGKKGSEVEEDIYGGVGGDGEGVYDTAGGGRKGMKYSQDGIYDNPLAGKGDDDLYDNPKMKRKVDGAVVRARNDTLEEDVYGSTGGVVEGFYDNPKFAKGREMKPSQEGIYDNPLGINGQEDHGYEDIPEDMGPEEGIYGGVQDTTGSDIYDNPKEVGGGKSPAMTFSGEGIYDNPGDVGGEDPIYDNQSGAVVEPENRLQKPRKKAQFDQSIYSRPTGQKPQVLSGPKEKWPLIHQPWFHGKMERIEAEAMLEKNGDFLVRESKKKQGQYVLTALAVDKPQHLLLVDSAGKVKAKDSEFTSVADLVYHFLDKGLPLFMDRTEVYLKRPVVNAFPSDDIDTDNAIYQETGTS